MESIPTFNTLKLSIDSEKGIAWIILSRPKKYNAMSWEMFNDIGNAFRFLSTRDDVLVVLLLGEGKHFCTGLDLMDSAENLVQNMSNPNKDVGRKAISTFKLVKDMQDNLSQAEECRVPVIVAMQGYAIGAAIDLASACDIWLCTDETMFSIKEVDVGLAADVGTLQRFPKIVGNQSWTRELAYTGRFFKG